MSPVEKEEDISETSYEDKDEIRNGKEYHKYEIPSEDAYNPNYHSNWTTSSHKIVYNLRGDNWGRGYIHHVGYELQFIEFAFNTYGFKQGLK